MFNRCFEMRLVKDLIWRDRVRKRVSLEREERVFEVREKEREKCRK